MGITSHGTHTTLGVVPKSSTSPSLPTQTCTSCSEQPLSFWSGGKVFPSQETKEFPHILFGKQQHRPHPRKLSYEEHVTPRP